MATAIVSSPEFRVTATFEGLGERTNLVFRQTFKLVKQFEQAKKYCIEGNEQNFDRLEQVLSES